MPNTDEKPKEGDEGTCSCGKPGTYVFNPYAWDICNEKILECMCDKCYQDSCDDI